MFLLFVGVVIVVTIVVVVVTVPTVVVVSIVRYRCWYYCYVIFLREKKKVMSYLLVLIHKRVVYPSLFYSFFSVAVTVDSYLA